ncbi:MAG TPA: type II secretion system major pseudopilin GspG, partial [Parvularculaceae bacterium]|nr:type II secretion system major pseudopilin GspG [Parvularculaceae bacterium]
MGVKSISKTLTDRRRQKGITLIELLVVLVILALISTMIVINVLPEADKARVKKAKLDIKALENALDLYRLDMLSYPTTEEGLGALLNPPADAANTEQYRAGGYLRKTNLKDPWGTPYQYRAPGEHGPYDLY